MRAKVNSINVRFATCPQCGYIREGYLTWKNRPARDTDYRVAPPTPYITICRVCQPEIPDTIVTTTYQDVKEEYNSYVGVRNTYGSYRALKLSQEENL